jgi:hypothetical protein
MMTSDQCYEDAARAVKHAVDGIVLSHHGGCSQNTAQPPLLILLKINNYAPHALGKSEQVFVDGGTRRGTDVIKALALMRLLWVSKGQHSSVWQVIPNLIGCVE